MIMKRLTTHILTALAAAALVAVPLNAQTRSGSNSRSGSGSGNTRSSSSSASRSSSSVSSPSSQTRSSAQSGNTKGLGSVSRSTQSSTQNRSATMSSPSGSVSRSGSNTRSSSSSSVSRSSSSSSSSSSSAANRSSAAPSTSSQVNRSAAPAAQPQAQTRSGSNQTRSSSQPARTGSNSRSTTATIQQQNRQSPNQPGGSVNRNQPQPGMSTQPGAPITVKNRQEPPRNFEGGRAPREIRLNPGPGRNIVRIPPMHRDPMPFGRAVRFWDGGHHYFGYRVSYLPTRYVRVVHWGIPYYVLDGIYYRRYGSYYYVSRPPFGIAFEPVLDNLAYAVCNFAYYYSVYNTYRTINENAQTIASQNATIAANNATIASQNATIALNAELAAKSYKEADKLGLVQSYADAGVEYYYEDGVFFTKDKDGKYITIVPPAGALVQELPDDYDTVTLDGTEYYKVDDTVYKLTIVDGSPYFEVLGQLTGTLAEKYNSYNTL